MPRTKIIGRPKLPKYKTRYTLSIRLTDGERALLEKKYGTVQEAINHLLEETKNETKVPRLD